MVRKTILSIFGLLLLLSTLASAGASLASPGRWEATDDRVLSGPQTEQNPILIPLGKSNVSLDGFCNIDQEYYDADSYTYTDYGGTGIVFLKHTGTDLYVCVAGTSGTLRDRFFRVYLDRDHAQEPLAEADDLGLQIDLATNAPSVVKGTGSGNYVPGTAFGWAAYSTLGNQDMAEYRIPIRLTNGWCGDPFGLAVYHHWASFIGDDYGWPSNQWYDQPQTWQQAVLASAPCTIPAYHLTPPTVNPGTALQLAGRLEGLGGKDVFTDTTYARTSRFTIPSEARGAALQQLGASGGFFAFNPTEAFTPIARGPLNANAIKGLACNFLMWNELFPWEQTPPDALNCEMPGRLPYQTETIWMAGQSSSGAEQSLPPTEVAIVVHVPLGVNIGTPGEPAYIPLTGPGGHLSLVLTTDDPQSNAWSLDGAVPGVAALAEPWHGRSLQPPSQHILIGLNQAMQALQAQFPGRSLNPGEPELAYYVDDPAVPQSLLMPVWTFPNASVQDGSETIFLRTPVVLAAPDLLPSVAITSPPSGSTFLPGQAVSLEGTIGGGTGPYTFTWSLEDGTVLEEGTTAGGAVSLLTSALPAGQREGLPISTTVHLSVVDSIGASASDHIWLRPAYAPVVFLPVIFRSAGGGLAALGEAGTQAIYRVGVEWVSLYNGTASDLPGVPPDGNGFYNNLRGYGWTHGLKYTNNSAWEKDWRDCSFGGADCSYGIDRAEFAYFAGHGSPARIYFGVNKDSYNFWGGKARFQVVKWAAFSSCQTTRVSSISDWFNAFQGGARILMGFQSNMADIAFGNPLADNMRIPTFFGMIEMPWLQRTIPQAWTQTAFGLNAGKPSYLYVTGQGVDTSLDKLPKNGDPAPANPYPIQWFYWVWWD